MTLFPFVELKVGTTEITRVPPQYLKRFVYKSAITSVSSVEFVVIDPTYREMEEAILAADRDTNPINARFGYLDRNGSIGTDWITCTLRNFTPRLSAAGEEIVANCYVDAIGAIGNVKSAQFTGRISSVIAQICDRLDLVPCPGNEETNDDINEKHPENEGSPRVWSNKNMTIFDFISKELQPIARSATSKSNFDFWIEGNTRLSVQAARPVLHFHTKESSACTRRKNNIINLTYIAGRNDSVLEWAPNYSSVQLGTLGVGGLVTRAYNPRTKQFKAIVGNIKEYSDTVSVGGGNRTTARPTNPADSSDDTQAQMWIISTEKTQEEVEAKARSDWEQLKRTLFDGTLTLVGTKELVGLGANDLINLQVMIPDPRSATKFRTHWSSGIYVATEVTHIIEGSYTIVCQIQRDTINRGPVEVNGAQLSK